MRCLKSQSFISLHSYSDLVDSRITNNFHTNIYHIYISIMIFVSQQTELLIGIGRSDTNVYLRLQSLLFMEKLFMLTMIAFLLLWIFIIVKFKLSLAKSLPVKNLLPQNVGPIISYCIIIIIIFKTESAAQAHERVRALYQSKDPAPHNQSISGRKKRKQYETKIKRLGQQESIGSALKILQSHIIKHRVAIRSCQRDAERSTKVLQYLFAPNLQQGGANECPRATKAPRVTRAGRLRKKRGTYWLSRLSPASTESTCLCNFPFSMFWTNTV